MQIKTPVGTYAMPEELTFREMALLKSQTGLLPAQVPDALEAGDASVIIAFVMIAAARAGRVVSEEVALDWTLTDIEFLDDDELEDEEPKKKGSKKGSDPS